MVKEINSKEDLQSEIASLKNKLTVLTNELEKKDFEYNALFESTNDALFLIDLETECYLKVNQQAVEIFGYTSQEELLLQPHPPHNLDFLSQVYHHYPGQRLFPWPSEKWSRPVRQLIFDL